MTKKLSGTVAVLICIVHILLGMALTKNALFYSIVITALSFKPKKETYLPLPGSLRIG